VDVAAIGDALGHGDERFLADRCFSDRAAHHD
jgi:hypothetical protein